MNTIAKILSDRFRHDIKMSHFFEPLMNVVNSRCDMREAQYRRPVAVTASTIVTILLHAYVLFWFGTQAAPLAFSAAAPLPMISMELSAPPSPKVDQPLVTPQPPKEVVKPKRDKPKPKSKPKPTLSERLVKQVDELKQTVNEPLSAPPTGATPQALNHNALSAPRNDTYIPADSDAAYLNNPKPVYPLEARQRNWQGTVVLRVSVSEDGHVLQVNLQRSSGHETLDESALAAVKDWRFVPAKRGETPEPSWVSVPIVFKLE